MQIQDLLRRAAKLYPDVVAVEDPRERVTYAELAQRVLRLAAGLAREGVAPGDRVAIVARNRADYVALYFAAAHAGAALVPLSWRLRPAELAYVLGHARPRVLIAEDALCATLEQALAPRELALARFVLGEPRAGWRELAELALAPPTGTRAGAADEVVVQMYTSGTTGRPKGAMLTHANVAAVTTAWMQDLALEPGESRFLQVTPLFHVGGMLMVTSNVAAGTTLLLHPEFDPVAALTALSERGVTHTLMVPAMLQWVLSVPGIGERAFPALRMIAYGAAPMPAAVLLRAIEVFRCDFLQGYGLTETGGVLLVLRPSDHRFERGAPPPRRLASAGREILGVEVRVVDARGAEVAPGEVGEIVARGDNVTPGYFEDPEATARALRDGWFHTGDLATVDAEGFVHVVDRLGDMILVGGENVYPREVEDVLLAHPDVADAAAVGVPHDVWGEEVLAVVVPRSPGTAPDPRALIRHCRASLARHKCPAEIEFAERLPRNAAGKLLRRALRDPRWEGRERRI